MMWGSLWFAAKSGLELRQCSHPGCWPHLASPWSDKYFPLNNFKIAIYMYQISRALNRAGSRLALGLLQLPLVAAAYDYSSLILLRIPFDETLFDLSCDCPGSIDETCRTERLTGNEEKRNRA